MKDFEQNYVRAVDGDLDDPAAIEAVREELVHRGEQVDSIEIDKAFLDEFSRGVRHTELKNGDFFSHQILERIRDEEAAPQAARQTAGGGLMLWPRLAISGALMLLVAAVMTIALQPYNRQAEVGLTTRVLSVHTFEDGIEATPLSTSDDHYAVVWVSGLDFLPEDHSIQ